MSKLSKETIDRIKADALRHGEQEHGWDEMSKDYLEGALYEAGRAQLTINEIDSVVSWMDNGTFKDKLLAVLRKYKEGGEWIN